MTENRVTVNFVNVNAHFQFVLSVVNYIFNLFFGGVLEEEAVCVAVKHLDAHRFGMVEDLGDAVSSDGCCGFRDWWTVEVEAVSAENAVAGVQDDF